MLNEHPLVPESLVAGVPDERTATGKLMHYKLRDKAEAGAGLDDVEKP